MATKETGLQPCMQRTPVNQGWQLGKQVVCEQMQGALEPAFSMSESKVGRPHSRCRPQPPKK